MLEPSSSEDEDGNEGGSSRVTIRRNTREEPVAVHEVAVARESRPEVSSSSSRSSATVQGSGGNVSSSCTLPPVTSSSNHNLASRSTSPGSSSPHDGTEQSVVTLRSSSGDRLAVGQSSSHRNSIRPSSPTPSATSETRDSTSRLDDDAERAEKEESERKIRLQLYVFVIRCISYPFNGRQPSDLTKRNLKVQKHHLEQLINKFSAFLKGAGSEQTMLVSDEFFHTAIQNYYDYFLCTDRVHLMVRGGGCSFHDFKEVFRIQARKRIRSLPEPEGSTKEVLLTSWMAKFDCLYRGATSEVDESKKPSARIQKQHQFLEAENILTKEQLYDMFQNVLNIKKFEHQLLFNALQVIQPFFLSLSFYHKLSYPWNNLFFSSSPSFHPSFNDTFHLLSIFAFQLKSHFTFILAVLFSSQNVPLFRSFFLSQALSASSILMLGSIRNLSYFPNSTS